MHVKWRLIKTHFPWRLAGNLVTHQEVLPEVKYIMLGEFLKVFYGWQQRFHGINMVKSVSLMVTELPGILDTD